MTKAWSNVMTNVTSPIALRLDPKTVAVTICDGLVTVSYRYWLVYTGKKWNPQVQDVLAKADKVLGEKP